MRDRGGVKVWLPQAWDGGGEGAARCPRRAQWLLCVSVAGADRNNDPLWLHRLNSWQAVPETLSGSVCGDSSQAGPTGGRGDV